MATIHDDDIHIIDDDLRWPAGFVDEADRIRRPIALAMIVAPL